MTEHEQERVAEFDFYNPAYYRSAEHLKAVQLFDKFRKYCHSKSQIKQCALLVVEEILNGNFAPQDKKPINWYKVKEEINIL
jgi:hypothetical protein